MEYWNQEELEKLMNEEQSNVPDLSPITYIYSVLINRTEPDQVDFSKFTISDLKKTADDLYCLVLNDDDDGSIAIASEHTYSHTFAIQEEFEKFLKIESIFLPSPHRFI